MTEQSDNLRSRSFARIIDLISEGEIGGLVTGDLKSVYLDGTRVMNDDGSVNFPDITYALRTGANAQNYIPGFDAVESDRTVNVRVQNSSPVIQAVTDTTVDSVRVVLGFPQLTSQNTKTGDISGTSVSIAIDVQPDGGSYEQVKTDTITGKTTTRYQRSYRIKLPGTGPWNVRVRRTTSDTVDSFIQNQTWWDSLTQITTAKLRYPNSALAAMIIDSKQFPSIPARAYDVKLLKIQIPVNATVRADGSLTYSGSWDGTFKTEWCANPAWVFYDMITKERYGLGQYIDSDQVDKWSLYTIGRYCDELVPDGFGGFEPRFTCNIYLQQQAPAYKVLQDLATVFRGMIYWSSGLIVPTQDSPSEPVAIFTKSNVIDGHFLRSGSSLDTRHSVALVTWNDPANLYKQKVEYVEDAAAIQRYGIKETQIVAVGCTTRGQANRVGRWTLYSDANDTEMISFKVATDSLNVRPGQVVAIQDPDRAGVRLGGRLLSATTTQVVIDRAFSPTSGATYTLMAIMPDGSVDTAQISNISGSTLTLSEALNDTPLTGSVWAITSSIIELEEFRVVGITDNGDGTYEVNGLQYNALKYASVEQNFTLSPTVTSLINTPPPAPANIIVTENLYEKTGGVGVRVTVAWEATDRAVSYIFSYQRDDGNIVTIDNVQVTSYDIEDAVEGIYNFSVVGVGPTGKRGPAGVKTYEVIGKTATPADVTNFTMVGIADGVANLRVDRSTDLDVLIGGSLRVRWSPNTGAGFDEAVDVGEALPGTTTSFSIPHVSGTFLAKWVDSSGNASVNAVSIVSDIADLLGTERIDTINENPTFAGVKDGVVYDAELGGLKLAGTTLWDDMPGDIDDWDYLDYLGGVATEGLYDFATIVDLGARYNAKLMSNLIANGFNALDLFDQRVGLIDDWVSFDGTNIDDVNAINLYSKSDDNVTWTDFVPFFVAQVNARYLKFQTKLTSQDPAHNIRVQEAGVSIDIPDRVEEQNGLTSGTATYNATFTAPFFSAPGVGITAQNMQTGDYYLLANVDTDGFDITFYNSSGTIVSRVFNYLAKGQGLRSA